MCKLTPTVLLVVLSVFIYVNLLTLSKAVRMLSSVWRFFLLKKKEKRPPPKKKKKKHKKTTTTSKSSPQLTGMPRCSLSTSNEDVNRIHHFVRSLKTSSSNRRFRGSVVVKALLRHQTLSYHSGAKRTVPMEADRLWPYWRTVSCVWWWRMAHDGVLSDTRQCPMMKSKTVCRTSLCCI